MSPWVPRAKRWAGLLGSYFLAQGVVQVAGMASGILLVRALPLRDFALYTLASSVIAMLTLVSDLGSTSSLLHFSRIAAVREEPFHPYVEAVFDFRRTAYGLGAVVLLGIAPWVGEAQGFGRGESLAAAAVVVVTVWFQIGSSIRLVLLRIADRLGTAYRAELVGALSRPVLLGGWIFFVHGTAIAVLAIGALAPLLVFTLADSPAAHPARHPHARNDAPMRRGSRRALRRYLLPTLPSAVYFAVQGPLSIWLAATFAGTRSIAEVGALGRLGLLVGMLNGLSGAVLLPRLARIADTRAFCRRAFALSALVAALAGSIWLGALLVPELFLAVIGPRYAGLRSELLLLLFGSGLSVLGAYWANANLSRGWTRLQAVTLGGEVAAQIVLLCVLPLSSTRGVIWFQVGSAAAGLFFQLALFGVGLRWPKWAAWE